MFITDTRFVKKIDLTGLSKKVFQIFLSATFFGSVFITSEKFVNNINSPKYYFVLLSILLITSFIVGTQKYVNFYTVQSKMIYRGIIIVCVLQACYGVFQFMDWLPSNNFKFAITGSFENPAGFAAVLSIAFPMGLHLLITEKKGKQYLIGFGLLIVAIAVLFCLSRTGILTILVSSFVFYMFHDKTNNKFKGMRFYKFFPVLTICLLTVVVFVLYHIKRDSADGRLLIWKVSCEMLKDKPAFGHGYKAFESRYMDYQARFFKENPDSKFAQLADNVKHPFNELIKIAVEFGIVGLIVIMCFILLVFWKTIKLTFILRPVVLSGMVAFVIFSCFSYPSQYVSVWLLFSVYLFALLPIKQIKIQNNAISFFARGIFFIVCFLIFGNTLRQMQIEKKWKAIAISSFKGNTKEILLEYESLYASSLRKNPYFLYNYGAELNVIGQYDESIKILEKCKIYFNDYDLQILLANNYSKKGELEKAIQIYQHASNMIPNRFLPIYRVFSIYKERGQEDMAKELAITIRDKKIKIPSNFILAIKSEAREYIRILSQQNL